MIIIGSNGLLGSYLVKEAKSQNISVIGIDITEDKNNMDWYFKLDVSKDITGLMSILSTNPSNCIVNCAAFTDVDGADSYNNIQTVINSNIIIPQNIAISLERLDLIDTLFIHISTDYVYTPQGLYGYSKKIAEDILTKVFPQLKILIGRTTVLYGKNKGFVPWVIEKLKNNQEIKIVTDQVGSPTFAGDLAKQIFFIRNNNLYTKEIVSLCGKDSYSRYDLAIQIAKYFNLNTNLIIPIKTKDLKQGAERPMKDILVNNKQFLLANGYRFATLEDCLENLYK